MQARRVHVSVIFGTRPEAIKMAPIVRELRRRSQHFRVTVCVTGQHRHMLDQMIRLLRIPVDHDLDVMTPAQRLSDLTAHILKGLERVLPREHPDVVLVQGDTTTTLGASLAAFYHRIPVGHVEAGLRTNDRFAPFPEEIHRRLVSQIADFHFASTEWARQNLLKEGIPADRIVVTGNTVIDQLFEIQKWMARKPPRIAGLNGLDWKKRKLLLVTCHRRESWGPTLVGICESLKALATMRPEIEIVYPVHLNPNVWDVVHRHLQNVPRVHLIEPLDYPPFVWLMTKAYLVLTDSGGIQEEMPSLRRPVLVLRNKTERPEGIEAGVSQLVGTRPEAIIRAVLRVLDDPRAYRSFLKRRNPYGDGKAARRIVAWLYQRLGA